MAIPAEEGYLDAVIGLLRRRTGLTFPPERRHDLAGALQRAMRRVRTDDPGGYLRDVEEGGGGFHALVTELTVGETYFFREPRQFEFMRRETIPAILRARGAGALRAWSAGCASGEEAYSLAILLAEEGLGSRSSVLGTDLSRDRLARAREGVYTEWSFRGVPEQVRSRYFRRQGKGFELVPELRSRVEFRPLNLAADDFTPARARVEGMDLVLCRNVLIYLDRAAVTRVAARLLASLSDEGWLFLGASDPPLAPLVPCEVVLTDAGVAYRRTSVRAGTAALPRPAPSAAARSRASSGGLPRPAVRPAEQAGRAGVPGTPAAAPVAAAPAPAASTPTPAAEAAAARIRALADRGRLAEAGLACAEALETHRADPELLYLHALLLAEAGRHAEAALAARRVLYLDRTLVVAHVVLGRALAQQGDTKGARRALGNAERLLEAEPPGAVLRASGGETAARVREIVRAYRKLLKEAPG